MKFTAVFLIFVLITAHVYGTTATNSIAGGPQVKTNKADDKYIKISPKLLRRLSLKRKDPFLAGILSIGMWGIGHFYSGEYTKGSLFVFGDLIYKGLLHHQRLL